MATTTTDRQQGVASSSEAVDRRQGVNSSSAVKVPCRVATTANITLSGTQTIDGTAVVANDRVLVKNQTDPIENGIYDASAIAWTRSVDWAGNLDVKKGTSVRVTNGSSNQGEWYVATDNPIIPDTTATTITFSPITVDSVVFVQLTTDIIVDSTTPDRYVTTWYDSNKVVGSGTTWTSTATNTPARAGAGLYTDGYVYNANGDQYEISGSIFVEKFGAGPALSAAINTTAFTLAFDTQSVIQALPGTFTLNNLNFVGTSNKIFSGSGSDTVLDFSGVTSGDALSFGWDSGNGGCKNISLENFAITDSSGSSSADTLISLVGGIVGQSPSRTSGFFNLRNIDMLEFNNSSGIAIELDGVSHVHCDSVFQGYEWDCGEGWLFANTVNVNTGVWVFNNCSFRGEKRALRVNATTIMDSASFPGCFFANHTNAAAIETILFEGSDIISSFDFSGAHVENRHASYASGGYAVLVTGYLYGCNFEAMHISLGDGVNSSKYGFKFETANVLACKFSEIEFLRTKSFGNGGRLFYFDNDCVTDPDEPIHIESIWRNNGSAYVIDVEAGGSEDTIYKSIISDPTSENRQSTGTNRAYALEDSATPSVKGGKVFEVEEDWFDTGTHDGSNNVAIMADSGASFTVDALIGKIIRNTTDGSEGTITDNDATTVTATLSGGTDDDWDTNDAYVIGHDITDFNDEYKGQEITLINSSAQIVRLVHSTSTIRCKGGANLSLLDDGAVNLTRTLVLHWIQTSEAIDT